MTTRDDIRLWLLQGSEQGARYMLVVCDSFDHEDYPVYVLPSDNLERLAQEHSVNMQRVMECYDLQMDWEDQLKTGRNFQGWPKTKVFDMRDILLEQSGREL
jgi:hypothetical protein